MNVDILLVRGETTLGLRRVDDTLADALRRLGYTIAEVRPEYRIRVFLRSHITRFGVALDVAECLDSRIATALAMREFSPRCIIYCAWFSAALQPSRRLGRRTAIRFDSPPSLSRRGRRGAFVQRALERRAFRATKLLLPTGINPRQILLSVLPASADVVPLPVPVETAPASARSREPRAVMYAGNPQKKGLDIALAAWAQLDAPGMKLLVAGIEPDLGREWCKSGNVPVPESVEWVGMLQPAMFRALLRSSTIFLAASRYEDHGLAQLEALADGALLVTVPSDGPFEPLSLAERLPGPLVATDVTPEALAESLQAACHMSEAVRETYRSAARELIAAYSEKELDDRLTRLVLPRLLGFAGDTRHAADLEESHF